ncbi:MAG: CapA family protein [Acidimicrobiia bacterium]|nr:CapA family protein [Acidimicrobiia bacterium]
MSPGDPLSPDDTDITTYPSFSVPWEIAPALADAGYDGCSTASNHSLDRGGAGVTATLDHLDVAGLGHAGSARSEEEAATPTMYDVRGVEVGHLAYTEHFNGNSVPADQPWLVARIDLEKILADSSALRAAGARIVVVSLHWGSEFVSEPTDSQEAIAAALLASPDVDLVIGHHAHVVQPVEQINGEWVAYGLGNFLSNQYDTTCCPAESQDGVIAIFHFREGDDGGFTSESVEVVPTWVERPTYRILVASDALSQPDLAPSTRDALARSLERTLEVLDRRGGAPTVTEAAA